LLDRCSSSTQPRTHDQRRTNSRTEKETDKKSTKNDPKLHDLFSKFAQRITTEMSSYSQKIIAQFELELRKSKKFEQERVFPPKRRSAWILMHKWN
jgi:hypothetical protein